MAFLKRSVICLLVTAITVLDVFSVQAQTRSSNQIGIDNNVPQPWTPLVLNKQNSTIIIRCWERTYIFNENGIINQIISKGENLLSSPVRYRLDNKETLWNLDNIKILSKSQNKVTLAINSNTYLNKVKISQTVLADIYYDGLIYFKTKIYSEKAVNKDIKLEININKSITRYINRFANPTPEKKESWKSGNYVVDRSGFIPYWWIGDTEKGLFWFAESPENWRDFENLNAIEFDKTDKGGAKISFNFDDTNKDLNWSFNFGLQATPVKPLPDRWRERILVGSKDSNINIIWPHHGQPFELKYFGFPEAKNLKLFNDYVENITTPGKKTLVYNNITFMSEAVPEWKQNKTMWNAGAQDYSADVKAYGDAFTRANILDKSYQDFIVWKSYELLNNTKLNGYYVDYSMIGNLNQFKNIHKSLKTNQILPYYPFMKMRELYERFYKMVKDKNPENLVISHASARVVPPIIGFSDAYVDGEQFNQNITRVGADYLDVTNIESFQSEYSGKAYGIPGIFLPSFSEKNYSIIAPTQNLASLLLVHDISVWPIYSARVVWDEMFEALKSFKGWESAKFISYYDPRAIIGTNVSGVLASAFKNDKNEYLCIFTNTNSLESKFVSKLNVNLGNYIPVQKINRGTYRVISNNQIELTIKGKDYQVLYLKLKN